jgi:hypothetical protein
VVKVLYWSAVTLFTVAGLLAWQVAMNVGTNARTGADNGSMIDVVALVVCTVAAVGCWLGYRHLRTDPTDH